MANYLNTNEVKVFPFGKGRVTDPYCKTLNEQNITNLVRMLTDQKSYIVQATNDFIDFVIYGYYFKVQRAALSNLTMKPLFAYIQLEEQIPAYIFGGDYITQISDGEGTKGTPYNLSPGEYRIELTKEEEYYFNSTSTVKILKNDDDGITLVTDPDRSTETDGSITISPPVSFHITSSNDNTILCMVVEGEKISEVYEFQGLCFATEAPENDPNKDTVYYSIKLLDENGNIPADSFLKYSYDTKSLPLRIISGGTSKNL